MTTTDEDLARAAQGGDAQAFASLIARQYDRLYRLCFRLTGTQHDAEDLTQDICAALPVKLQRYDGRARLTTWLYRVAVNAAHDRRRKQASYNRAADGWGDWETNRQAALAENADRTTWLLAAMNSLPADLRDTLALTMDDLTHAQAAEILGISEGTVSWRLSEARKHLKALKQQEDV